MDDKIYKYTSIRSAISILRTKSILLNNPKNFNDPYDCDFVQDKSDYEKCQKLIKDYSVMKVFFSFLENKKLKFNGKDKLIVKSLQMELASTRKFLEKNEYYEGTPGFSMIQNMISNKNYEFKKAVELAVSKYNKIVDDSFEKIRDLARISCFSKTNRSILMWSHYADSHHGVCIEWNRPNSDSFREVKYQNNKHTVSLYKLLTHSLALDLLKKKDEMKYDTGELKEFLEPIFTKSTDWAYEEEVRCLYSNKTIKEPLFINDDNKVALEIENPTAIYIGCKAVGTYLNQLIELAKNRNIPVYFMRDSKYSYEMEIDWNRKYDIKPKMVKKDITLLRIIDDVNKCLNSSLYLSAFVSALIIPSFCSQVEIRGKTSAKEKYIEWIDTYMLTSQNDDKFIHLNGEICWKIKNDIDTRASIDLDELYDDYHIKNVKFRGQKKNYHNAYASSASKDVLLINITDFCVKMLNQANRCYEENKEKIERMKQIEIEDFDEIVDGLNENLVITQIDN